MYIKRQSEDLFLQASNFFKALLVTGPRQVGKTTMLKKLAENQKRNYVSLDDSAVRALAQTDPALFFQTYKPPILIDEVQRATELFPYIKILCDNTEEKGLIWMTGSQQYSMIKKVTESLAGRVGIINLYGFSSNELNGMPYDAPISFELDSLSERKKSMRFADITEIYRRIWQGGYPDVIDANPAMRKLYFDSYIDTYLLRDAMEDGGIGDTVKFRKFITACSALTGQLVNYATLAESADISEPTAKKWLEVLEGMHVVFLLRPYSNNKLKTIVKTPKLYFWDTGLCSHLAGWTSDELLMNGAACGAFFENYVITEIIKSYKYTGQQAEFNFYRDRNGKEVDFVICKNQQINLIEIKRTASPNKTMASSFSSVKVCEPFSLGTGAIICNYPDILPLTDTLITVPVSLI